MHYRQRAPGCAAIMVMGMLLATAGCRQRASEAAPRDLAGARAAPGGAVSATSGALIAPVEDRDPALPPLLTGIYPGVPCALTAPGPAAPGRCRGGRSGDEGYRRFSLPANRPIDITFDQSVSADSLVLGASCGTGSVRVEAMTADGTCAGAVAGALQVRERGVRFWPTEPWTAGARYRLVLVAGDDSRCDAGEICGSSQLPLNTDPLEGVDDAGGPPVTIAFTGAPASAHTYVLLVSPQAPQANRVAVQVTGRSGIVSSARIDQPDCMPGITGVQGCVSLAADLAVSIADKRSDCTIGEDPRGRPIVVPRCAPARIYPGILYGGSLTLDAKVTGLGTLEDLRTERLVLRLREREGKPITGYLIASPQGPRFVADLELYMDAPNLRILGGVASHDLHSKPISLRVEGTLALVDENRVSVTLTNTTPTPIHVKVSALLSGRIELVIPAGTMQLRLVGEAAAGESLRERLP